MTRLQRLPSLVCGVLFLAASAAALGQYKVVGPDGRITYTDRPSEATREAVRVQPVRAAENAGSAGLSPSATGGLPYALRQVAERFPVTLYTRAGCAVCDRGRGALRQRGIPFAERTVDTDADVQALQGLEGLREVPLLRIGAQQLRGYNELEWSSYLDAAGYPGASQLPAGWRGWEPTPLVAAGGRRQAASPPAPVAPPEPARLPPTLEAAPGGIRF
jgi:glutaredoxin